MAITIRPLLLILPSPVVAHSAKYNPHWMRNVVVGERDLRGAPGERKQAASDAIALTIAIGPR